MKKVRFRDPAGAIRTGTYIDDEVRFGGRSYAWDEVTVLAPCQPSKIVCVGRNYAEHADERGARVPDRPHLFLKPPSSVASHRDRLVLPGQGTRVDPEAELGVVIGMQVRNVPRDEAMSIVAGFTCVNDLSNRTEQDREQNWVRGKAFDNAAPLGPVLTTPDELPGDARIGLRVNGETRQSARIDQMVFPVPRLIEEITRSMTLEPGDVIATGTPEGVAPVEHGDEIEVEIEGVGVLRNTVERPSDA